MYLEDFSFEILKSVEKVNNLQKKVLLPVINSHFRNNLKNRIIAVWGLAFKPKTDDMREAPSLVMINALKKAGARLKVYDPVAMDEARKVLGNGVEYCEKNYDALKGAHALLICTEWNEFRRPDFGLMKKVMKQPVVFDGRNIYTPDLMEKYGFKYYCIGKRTV